MARRSRYPPAATMLVSRRCSIRDLVEIEVTAVGGGRPRCHAEEAEMDVPAGGGARHRMSTGSATTSKLIDAVRAARPDVAGRPGVSTWQRLGCRTHWPSAATRRRWCTAPASTGYHVQSDIPAAVAPYPQVRVARRPRPHPLLVDALVERLEQASPDGAVVLVGAGSTRREAADELAETRPVAGRTACLRRPGCRRWATTYAMPSPRPVRPYGWRPTCSRRVSSSRRCARRRTGRSGGCADRRPSGTRRTRLGAARRSLTGPATTEGECLAPTAGPVDFAEFTDGTAR